MNKIKNYIKTHIPETVCVILAVLIFLVMSIYAIVLAVQARNENENAFNSLNKPIMVKNMPDENDEFDEYSGKYYIVGNGEKYHADTCSYVKNASKLEEITAKDIETSGYEPCKKCITK